MKEANAWLLSIGSGRFAAVGERELLHLAPQPEIFDVPLAPCHCMRVLPWQEQLLPVWDIAAWLGRDTGTKTLPLAAITGYQSRPRETPRLGAIALLEPPVRIQVSNSQACDLPKGEAGWHELALSCFLYEEKPVPILDLYRMFSAALSTVPEMETAEKF